MRQWNIGDAVLIKHPIVTSLYPELKGKVGLISGYYFHKRPGTYYVFFPDLPYSIENSYMHDFKSESDIEKLSWTIWGDHLVAAEL